MNKLLLLSTLFLFLATGCQKETDPCDGVTCQNGGTCLSLLGECSCPMWYEGANCETEMRTKFLGNYTGLLTTNGQQQNTTHLISVALGGPQYLYAEFMYFELNTVSTFNIPLQTISLSGIAYAANGSGYFSGNQMVWAMYITGNGVTNQAVSFIGYK